MERLTENKIILIYQRTRLDNMVARFNTVSQTQFYVEHLGADFSDYLREHKDYYACITLAEKILSGIGIVQKLEREFLPNFIFGNGDIVVAIGRDGLVANSLKYLDGQPLVGVNPDPGRWQGVLLPFEVNDLEGVLSRIIRERCQFKQVTMARVDLNDGQVLYGVNDLFIGTRSHVSARYRLHLGSAAEDQSSSGVIISTGLGSTGWFKSIIRGAVSVAYGFLGQQAPDDFNSAIAWDSDFLYYSVREPYPSKSSQANLVFGKVTKNHPLKIISQMSENGVIFSDGVEKDFLAFNSGVSAVISLAAKKGILAV